MFKNRSTELELMDDLNLSNEDLRKNLDELEVINKWLGGNKVVTNALSRVLTKRKPNLTNPITIADIGCGGGDILREVADWAGQKKISVNLTGIDANNFMVNYAQQKCNAYKNISVIQENIFDTHFKTHRYDVIICSLFCHHFTTPELINLLKQLHQQANIAVIINDLHRHPLAYYSIKYITKLFSGSYLVKNDAPISVLRAFKKPEIQNIVEQAGVTHFSLRWLWAFRWQIILYKNAS